MSTIKKLFYFAIFFVLTLAINNKVHAISDWSFSTIPMGGNISGKPGDTIGWGYEIKNLDSNNWLIINNLNANVFQNGIPADANFDYPILAPLSNITVPYDAKRGLYKFTWNSSAPEGFVNTGLFTLTAEFWDGDPMNGGKFVDKALDKTAYYSIEVIKGPETTKYSFLKIVLTILSFLILLGVLFYFIRKIRNGRSYRQV